MRLFLICLGGAMGTGARYLVSLWMLDVLGLSFPFGTLAVNLIGSFLIGGIMHIGLATDFLTPTLRLALVTGVLGGFTTYSAFSYETMRLLQGAWSMAAVNVGVTLIGCLLATFAGAAVGRWMVGG